MKAIITRPSPDGESFAAEAARIGVEPILSPVMAIRRRAGPVDLAGVGTLAFTSANGVRVFAGLVRERSLPVFAVGETTAAAARRAGFVAVETAAGEATSLVDVISRSKPQSAVLHLAGSDRAGDLCALLAARGIESRRAVIYDAVEIADLSTEAKAALADSRQSVAVVLFSPRSARLFLKQARAAGLAGALGGALAVCLSREVALAAREVEWNEVEIASARRGEAMLALLAAACAGRKGRNAPGR